MSRPLRIALLTHSHLPRGGVVHAIELGEALHALGHEVAVHVPLPEGARLFRQTRCAVVPVAVSGVGTQGAPAGLRERVARRIGDYVAHFARAGKGQGGSWDVLHAQDSISANALATLAEQGAIPGYVRTVHHLDVFDDPQLMAWQARGVKAASALCCVSRTWQDELTRSHGLEATLVGNGVDGRRWRPATPEDEAEHAALRRSLGLRAGARQGEPVLLAVGGIEARKNTLRLLESFVRLRQRHPRAQLVVAGGASLLDHDAYRAQFHAMAQAAGLRAGPGEALLLTGELPDEHMPALMRAADVLAFPSVKEGFGLVVLEALACGLPAVVSRIAPFTEYLAEGDVAWADPLDPVSIAAALCRQLDQLADPAQAAAQRERGFAVAARFTWQAAAERHLAAYRRWLAALPLLQTEPSHA